MSEKVQRIDEYHFISPDVHGNVYPSNAVVLQENIPYNIALREYVYSLDEVQLEEYREELRQLSFKYQGPGGP